MKGYKKYIAALAAMAVLAGGLSSCQDDIDAPNVTAPVAKNQANTSILELKKKFWDDASNYIWNTPNQADATPSTIPAKEDGSHYIISGRVISSDEQGNVFKSLVIQDGTAAIALSINQYNLYLNYRRGQEIVLDVTGMYIGKYNGLLQLGYPEWYANGNAWEASFMAPELFRQHVELNGDPELAKLDTLEVNSFSELPSTPDGLMQWQSQLVKFNNVEFANGGNETFATYHSSGVNQSIVDTDGSSLPVRTSGYSSFWNKTLPKGKLDVVCILSYYGTSGWQLILNDYQGCMNIGNPTVGKGAESNPWTVDEAILAQEGTGTHSGWVTGYIVGAVAPEVSAVTSNDDVEWVKDPVLNNTLVIGQTADTRDIAHALVIELPYGSRLRDLGNLVDHPENFGRQIWIRGTLGSVLSTYGVTGNNGALGTWRIEGVDTSAGEIKNGDGSKDSPYAPAQVIGGTASGTAWVKGYIVGSSNGKSASDFKPGVEDPSTSNIFIASTPDETDYTKCVPVQLPVGNVRTALNLKDNPGNLGKMVSVYGSIEKYFGQQGVKAVTEYDIAGGTVTPPQTGTGTGTETDPFSVQSIIAFNPASTTETEHAGVWVKGYIVGWADMSTEYVINANTARFSTPATMATNLLMAETPGTTDVSKCIGVQLPSGAVRSALNLVDNPGNLGKEVMVKGDVLRYSGVPGIRNTSAYKIDGGGDTPDEPKPGAVVTSLDQNFDASTSLPEGWTQMQVAGTKTWYVNTFNGNNYAAMTGYKGTAPFDSWMFSPAIDIAKCADKKLTFETQVNGYGSTTTVFEVYALNAADPAKATVKQKLNATMAVAPASGYSSWTQSGELDLSQFSGNVYIGFRYYATQDANYATWCVDNVKLNAGGGNTGGGDEPQPPTPAGDYKGDFNSFNGGTAKSSPYGTYTNATGWTGENAIVLGGTDGTDANPYFTFIGGAGVLAPTLNGKAGSCGRLLSPVLTGGCKTLTFNYGFAFTETKCSFRVDVKDAQGNVVKTDTVELTSITKLHAYSYSLDVNVSGDFTIEITNLGITQSTGNKDRVSIWNLTRTAM